MSDDPTPTTAPHNRGCGQMVLLVALAWPVLLVHGIWREHRKAASA